MYAFGFSFLFTGWCTAQDQKSWWQELNKIDPSVASIFDEEKLDYAEQGCEEIKLKYKNDPADIRLKKYFKEYFDFDLQNSQEDGLQFAVKIMNQLIKEDYIDCFYKVRISPEKCSSFYPLFTPGLKFFKDSVLKAIQ